MSTQNVTTGDAFIRTRQTMLNEWFQTYLPILLSDPDDTVEPSAAPEEDAPTVN